MPTRPHLSRWRAAALRLGKPGVVLGGAVDRAAVAGIRGRNATPPGVTTTAGAATNEDDAYRRVWTTAAEGVGARVEALPGGFLRATKGGKTAWLWRQETDLDGVTTLRLAADKPVVHGLLAAAGVSVPPHAAFDAGDPGAALAFLEAHGRCAVKPARGTARGQGVTTGVTSPADLDRAVLLAARQDRRILIEPQLDGPVLRLLLLDGELLDAVARHAPVLEGDGTSSVKRLVAGENARRAGARAGGNAEAGPNADAGGNVGANARTGPDAGAEPEARLGTSPLTIDLDMALTLRAQGLDLKATPGAGRRFAVKGVCNENAAADNVRQTDLPGATIEQARAAAAAVGLRLAGVDVIGDVVLEVNGTPGFLVHERAHGPAPAANPAEAVLRTLLA